MEEREVVVVGAGPAGSSAAIALAKNGHDVLLLDREDFPRDKACGDAISLGAIDELDKLFDIEKARYQQWLIEKARYHRVGTLLIVSPKGHRYQRKDRRETLTYIVPRVDFDALLHSHAISCGAEFRRANVTEPLIDKDNGGVYGVRVRSNGTSSEIGARVVVGADGSTSVIGRKLLPTPYQDRHRAVALRAYIDDIEIEDPHQFEFYLYRGILPGYAWIFPYGDCRANIGLGMRLDKYKFLREKESLKEMLDRFLEIPVAKPGTETELVPLRKRLSPKSPLKVRDIATWPLNLGSQRKLQLVYNGALLVGDAASLTDPLSGTGICNAIKSARIAADVVHEALKSLESADQELVDQVIVKGEQGEYLSDHALRPYGRRITRSLRPRMLRSHFYQIVLFNCPGLIDCLVRLGRCSTKIAGRILETASP